MIWKNESPVDLEAAAADALVEREVCAKIVQEAEDRTGWAWLSLVAEEIRARPAP